MDNIEWPFRASEAIAGGLLTAREVRRFHEAVYPGVWMPRGEELTAIQRARAAWLWSRRRGVVAGLSAAAMHGARWIDGSAPADLIHANRRGPALLAVRSDRLLHDEVQFVESMRVTTGARTAFDLGRWLPLVDGLQRIDALMNATDVKVTDVEFVITAHPGAPGLRRLRQTLSLADGGAESPYESLTRLAFLRSGFPRPVTQIPVADSYGQVFARIDFGWPEFRVGVEFDGAHHWTDPRQRTWDVERYARIAEMGWILIRVTSGMLRGRRPLFLERAGAALIARGCPRTW